MKIKNRALPYDKVLAIPPEAHLSPKRPSIFFRTLLKLLSSPELHDVDFSYTAAGMERLGPDEPALFLMNHSSFIDLKIAATILYPRPFNIVCTSDGFVGKRGLMRNLGCIPITGCGGKLDYRHSPACSYSLYSDYYWYELGDMICIGDANALYYCFPKTAEDVVAKARLAAEELFKLRQR